MSCPVLDKHTSAVSSLKVELQLCAAYRRFGQRRTAYTPVVPKDYNIIIKYNII